MKKICIVILATASVMALQLSTQASADNPMLKRGLASGGDVPAMLFHSLEITPSVEITRSSPTTTNTNSGDGGNRIVITGQRIKTYRCTYHYTNGTGSPRTTVRVFPRSCPAYIDVFVSCGIGESFVGGRCVTPPPTTGGGGTAPPPPQEEEECEKSEITGNWIKKPSIEFDSFSINCPDFFSCLQIVDGVSLQSLSFVAIVSGNAKVNWSANCQDCNKNWSVNRGADVIIQNAEVSLPIPLACSAVLWASTRPIRTPQSRNRVYSYLAWSCRAVFLSRAAAAYKKGKRAVVAAAKTGIAGKIVNGVLKDGPTKLCKLNPQ